jgi:coiled-coil domain-containing protein 12
MEDSRKARLAALTSRAGRTKTAEPENDTAEETTQDASAEAQGGKETKKALYFRNYAPNDNSLQQDEDESSAPASKRPRTDENSKSALQEALDKAKQDISSTTKNNDMTTLAPKKINWDLKRDISDKLAKLERRTQKAIVELLKERLEKEASFQTNSDSDLD